MTTSTIKGSSYQAIKGMRLARQFIDLVLYSNLWIALAALTMCLQTQYLLFGELTPGPLSGFLFFATIFLYNAHRIIGLARVQPFRDKGRFGIIAQYRVIFLVTGGLAALAGTWFFFHLERMIQGMLLLPCLIGAGYVLPILRGSKRFRDLNHIKAFLVISTWTWVTVLLPAAEFNWAFTAPTLLMTMERLLFLFALILPFDIRDLKVDAYTRVATLPSRLGSRRTKGVAGASLGGMLVFTYLNYRIDVYSPGVLGAIIGSAVFSFLLIWFARSDRHDYYFTGLVDGMMILQFLLILLAKGLES